MIVRAALALGLLLGGCVPTLTQAGTTLHRCERLRQFRDAYTFGVAGASVLAGAGGLSTLQLDGEDSKRHAAELSLVAGVAAAVLGVMSTATGNAYAEEGCPELFSKARAGVKSGS